MVQKIYHYFPQDDWEHAEFVSSSLNEQSNHLMRWTVMCWQDNEQNIKITRLLLLLYKAYSVD